MCREKGTMDGACDLSAKGQRWKEKVNNFREKIKALKKKTSFFYKIRSRIHGYDLALHLVITWKLYGPLNSLLKCVTGSCFFFVTK